jgi:hypothetical protein
MDPRFRGDDMVKGRDDMIWTVIPACAGMTFGGVDIGGVEVRIASNETVTEQGIIASEFWLLNACNLLS